MVYEALAPRTKNHHHHHHESQQQQQQQQPPTPLSPSLPTAMPLMVPEDIPQLPMTPPDPIDAPLPDHSSAASKDAASVVTAIHVIATERAALAHLEHLYQNDRLAQENLARAVDQIVRCIQTGGKLVVCGVGKSGKIGKKLEATMNSLGIVSTFLHPTEALHGDLGMIRPIDTLLLISFSGRTPELMLLLPHIPSTVPVIALTSHSHPSTCPLLSYQSPEMAILLPAPIHEDEAFSFGVCAPTSSTTVALALGDALAIAAARRMHTLPGRGPAEVFKSYHPGGAIGAAFGVSSPMSMSTSTSTTSFSSMPSETKYHSRNGGGGSGSGKRRPSISPSTSSSPSMSSSTVASSFQDPSMPPPLSLSQDLQSSPLMISTLMTPLRHIPLVAAVPNAITTSSRDIRLLDILLTAIQHPDSKSWVFLRESEIIPPRHVRTLARSGNVDMTVAEMCREEGLTQTEVAVHPNDWLFVSSSDSVEDVKRLVEDGDRERKRQGLPAYTVVAVLKDGIVSSSSSSSGASRPNLDVNLEKDCLGVLDVEDLWGDTG